MKKSLIILFFMTTFAFSAFGQSSKYEYGMATMYGKDMVGKKTTSGQGFNPNALTAAHKTLEYGSLIEVESLENGNKVQVIINDRGPGEANRILYLSKQATSQLKHLDTDAFYVKITLLKKGTGVITNQVEDLSIVSNDEALIITEQKEAASDETRVKVETPKTNNSEASSYTEKTLEREMVDKVIDLDLDNADLDKDFDVSDPMEDVLKNDKVVVEEKEDETPTTDKNRGHDVSEEVEITLADTNQMITSDEMTNNMTIVTNESQITNTATRESVEIQPESTNNSGNIVESVTMDTNMITEDDLDPIEVEPDNVQLNEEKKIDPWKKYEPKANPDVLLTNLNAIKVEKTEIDKELVVEIEGPEEVEQEEKIETNKITITETNVVTIVKEVEPGKKEPLTTDKKDVKKPDYKVDAQGYSYVVQAGAFQKDENALKLYEKMIKKGYPVFTTVVYVKGKRYVRVRIGYYGSWAEAREMQRKIKAQKIPALIVKLKLEEK